MQFHPFASVFPLLEGKDFDKFVVDIRAHGLREPVWTYGGQILDGRNRWRACQELGIEPATQPYTGDDPLAFVISENLHRRHLDESGRAMAASRIANLGQGRPAEKPANLPVLAVTQPQAADLLNVGERSVRHARVVQDRGAPELVGAVDRGAVAVSEASAVARLPVETQRQLVAAVLDGTAATLRDAARTRSREDKLASLRPAGPLAALARYHLLLADPPWEYEFAESESRALDNQYPTMSLDEICALPVATELAEDDALLFLWATPPKLEEALTVMRAWGFTYRTQWIWIKDRIGMGYYARQQHEIVLIGRRGEFPAPAPELRPSSVFHAARTTHSTKPPEVHERIERMYPGVPAIELFARTSREGWAAWGAEAPVAT